ncbi:Sulfotransferase [Quillaja saponaria]|uniref:Sulfotransferase n=1 Tax=Quillaja saponaria TaxID=32244 RepID=A0AAD7LH95_QUISA|nr:Sulfotransferase [Quillaja saponaria]
MEATDTLVTKTPKKSALTLRMVVLVFAAVCGVYICSICLEQIRTNTKNKFTGIKVLNQSCHPPSIKDLEIPYLHYPKPKTFSRDECVCNPVRFFAILSMQRSGSGWFETLLNSHINVSSNGEIFSVIDRRKNVSSILKTMDKVYNLDWFTSASKNECSAAVGFKWMLNQGLMENHKEIVDYFKKRRVSAIFLFRRNLLRRMISVIANSYDKNAKLLNGTHKSHVHSPVEAQILANYRPKLNVTLLIPELEQIEDTAAKAIEHFKSTRHIVLYYEDIVNNRTKLKDVQEFLRLPNRDLQSRQVKIHTAPLSKQVENWDEVRKALTGTPHECFLHEDKQM